jgi:site-specific DNA-methyltransferase (adenine-specific)
MDNLELMKQIEDNTINLIYIDPPFFTNTVRKKGNIKYEDVWGSLSDYLDFIKVRIKQIHRILTEEGSFYLHCDWRASHYLKIICDEIFGYDNFINEIIWYYSNKYAVGNERYCRDYDSIFLYSKSEKYYFNPIVKKIKDTTRLRHYRGYGDKRKYSPDGYRILGEVWEIFYINSISKERLAYPDQKPEELLERIIKTSSKENEIVADFFIGSGTTLAVAKRLRRRFIGCDINPKAIQITKERLRNTNQFKNILQFQND